MDNLAHIRVGERLIGRGQPTYIVAEIGINHNGDMELARRMIDAAREAGADAVKFQNYCTEDFISDDTLTISYKSIGRVVTEPQRTLFERCQLTAADVESLIAHCAETGIDFHSTPTNVQGIELLRRLGVGVLKNGSDFLCNTFLVAEMARSGLPTVLSTGMATLEEIDQAVRTFRDAGGRDLVLLHCVSQYPAPAKELNLSRIPVLERAFGVPTGFSDHSEGTLAACLAVTQGACWIEKHFTTDRRLPGPDHAFSSDPQEFKQLVENVRMTQRMLGDSRVGIFSAAEEANREAFRLSCAASRDIDAGAILERDDIAFFRPGSGLPPSLRELLVGRRLLRSVKRGEILRFSFLN